MLKYRAPFTKQDGSSIPSWGLMPISKDCPFVDAAWNPEEKSLNLLVDSSKEYFREKAIKTEKGDYVRNKDGSYKTREIKYAQYYEHHLTNPDDIVFFLERYVTNNFVEEVTEEKEIA